MTDLEADRPVVQFTLNSKGPSKRPEQLARLLETSLEREFPAARGVIEISHSVEDGVITILHLEALEEAVAKRLAHRARVVYNEFMINPWY